MTENEAREKIATALNKLETAPGDKMEVGDSQVDYHIDGIIEAGGDMWNDTVASDYIKDLESQVEQEMQAPDLLKTEEEG